LNEVAVLYRAHFHAVELQLELSRRGIPYVITSGVRFFEQAHIKDVASFVRLIANPHDEVAFKRMVKLLPGIGNKSADNLWNAWEKSLPVAEVADPGSPEAEQTTTATAAGDRGYNGSFGERIRALSVGAKSKKSWDQLAFTLDEMAPGGVPNPRSEMITSVVEAI